MTAPAVTAVRSIELGAGDLPSSEKFYEDIWLLEKVASKDDVAYFRAAGPEHHVVALHKNKPAGIVRINLAAADRAAVDALHAALQKEAVTIVHPPRDLDEPGGGYGFAFTDIEGREFRIIAGIPDHADVDHRADRPEKISHIVIASNPDDSVAKLFCESLGFRLRDQTDRANFIGCNSDHHSLAFGRIGGTALNHVAFDTGSIDGEMRAAGRLKKNGYPIEWGIGRHGPGANVFAYFLDPNGYAIEYTTEMEQVDDATYKPGDPVSWKRAPHSDQWGTAEGPTQRFKDAISGKLAKN
jgi:catechol-2,3-dioxygenase